MAGETSRNVWKGTSKSEPKSKRRRRAQLGPRAATSMVTRSQRNAGVSPFHGLPTEVFNMILDRLSVLEVSVFSMVSKEITGHVVDYISTLAWKKKMIYGSCHPSTLRKEISSIEHYRYLGLLFKRCTLLLPTRERLKFVFTKFSQVPCFMMDQCLTLNCKGFSLYGVFLRTLIAGWDEHEWQRVYKFLRDLTNLTQKVEAVIMGKPGVRWHQELQVRLFCRHVLLDPWSNELESQFWLTQLLRPWSMVNKAHLLFILYGPLGPEGSLGWVDMVERGVPYNTLLDLAWVILLLVGKPDDSDQRDKSMLTIVEKLMVIPLPWHVENVASLMVLCGSSFSYHVLASKAITGQLTEISRLIVFIILVCEKERLHMSWPMKLVQYIFGELSTDLEKRHFIQQLENMFSQVVMETFVGNHFEEREMFQDLTVLLNSRANFHSQLFHMFLSRNDVD